MTQERAVPAIVEATVEATQQAAQAVGDQLTAALQEVKPKLRGWLHAVTSPLALLAGIALIALSPTTTTRIASAIFASTALLLFTVSAIFHRGTWQPRTWTFLRRFDHANIFLLIAGSYTPFTLVLLEGRSRITLLSVVWTGALLGVLFRILWTNAPRWLYVPIYIALGWAAVFYGEEFAAQGSPTVMTLIVAGGVLYTAGALIYGLRRPDPFPRWFGYHEVFHSLTIVAFASHYTGVLLATSAVG